MLEASDVRKIDKRGMASLISSLPDQIVRSERAARELRPLDKRPRAVYFVGMGGSAIAGDVFSSWIREFTEMDMAILRDYGLPSAAGPDDLVIALSYSGNTEETLSAAKDALVRGCELIGVTSGGSLLELCRRSKKPAAVLPSGVLAPRAAFGLLFGPLPIIFEQWIPTDLSDYISEAVSHLHDLRKSFRPDVREEENPAKSIARRLAKKIPLIYGAGPMKPVAKRWQTQLNENAKMLAFSSSFPEADHNEIVGWVEDRAAAKFQPVILRDIAESKKMRKRLDETVLLMEENVKVVQVHDAAESLLARMLGTLYLGDFVSLYSAVLKEVDPTPIRPIQKLKKRLAS